ncbi:hypothetical protein [Rhodovibrio salinarum]|uniref:LPP20 lipoprotein n=1 Tax=Rhodovibrio salinarum TaxID=1087 RepID=A0A934QJU2_9PROT|nr:hypothetical protein [Rhodovibrio salinarum]MBK1698226.1 hypothetical protein [Rhodovibrio salinarum]
MPCLFTIRRLIVSTVAAGAWALLASGPAAAADLVTVEGHGCHVRGGEQASDVARNAALAGAKRQAVDIYRSEVRSQTDAGTFEVDSDRARAAIADALTNVNVLSLTEQDREICAKIRGQIDPEAIRAVLSDASASEPEIDPGALQGDTRCRAYLPARVKLTQPLAGAGRVETRDSLIRRLQMEAVRQQRGSLVRGASQILTASKNGDVRERFMSRMRAQARGLVKYDVVSEEVLAQAGQQVLSITIDARVCVPREPLPRTVAVVATRSTRGAPVPELRNILEQELAHSSGLVVVSNSGLSDVEVSAEIINVGLIERNLTAADLGPGQGALAGRYYQLTATLSGMATVMGSGAQVTRQVDVRQMVPAKQDKRLATETFVKRKMVALAQKLRSGLDRELGIADAAGNKNAGAQPGSAGQGASGDVGGGLNH